MRPWTSEQKFDYNNWLLRAIDDAELAAGCIHYHANPELNKEVREKIKKACELLEEALCEELYEPDDYYLTRRGV